MQPTVWMLFFHCNHRGHSLIQSSPQLCTINLNLTTKCWTPKPNPQNSVYFSWKGPGVVTAPANEEFQVSRGHKLELIQSTF